MDLYSYCCVIKNKLLRNHRSTRHELNSKTKKHKTILYKGKKIAEKSAITPRKTINCFAPQLGVIILKLI